MENNTYLDQVVQQQAHVEGELRTRAKRNLVAPAAAMMGLAREEPAGTAVEYRITGWWSKTVVVPPNAYVVHTRRGRPEPVTLGLGVSFRYDPYTDAFLVIPAAVQTLLINARCISSERQGVLVQAYVQWVIDDLRTAYRTLDFSDSSDPMRLVNVQLREQAEAAIKDKVATTPIDDILSDRQPIIEELTHRLRAVAEGGLGLKIVTVQIKEAVVSSTKLWENLQKPFRAEREILARLAEIDSRQQITQRELETQRRLDALKAEQEAERHRLEQQAEQRRITERAETEKARRMADEALAAHRAELDAAALSRELETLRRQIEMEKAKAELEQLRSRLTIERDDDDHKARAAREERDVEVLAKRRAAENDLSEANVRSRLIDKMPEIAAAMPRAQELRQIVVSGDGANGLTGLMAQLLSAIEHRNGNG